LETSGLLWCGLTLFFENQSKPEVSKANQTFGNKSFQSKKSIFSFVSGSEATLTPKSHTFVLVWEGFGLLP